MILSSSLFNLFTELINYLTSHVLNAKGLTYVLHITSSYKNGF